MIIRAATAIDIPAILPMVAQICALHQSWDEAKFGFLPNPETLYQGWLEKQVEDSRSVFLVAAEAELAGFLIATIEREVPIYRLWEYGYIHDLWVEPNYRRSGVARQLVKQAIEQFQAIGVAQVRLEVATANEAARDLFQTCGFRVSTTEMLIELPS